LIRRGLDPSDAPSPKRPRPGRTPPTPEAIQPLFPELEILRLVGKGGMGAVYQAIQRDLQRPIALKLLWTAGEVDAAFEERFLREGRTLARLSHPNIVAVHGAGKRHDPQLPAPYYWIAMEYVDGPNLRQLLQRGRLEPAQALPIVKQVCDALDYAHAQGVVHRDIKPENVLVARDGRVKVADFGLAKLLASDRAESMLTATDDVFGTPHYMAPEQIEQTRDVDHRADIYSLGVVFYEVLTGELPLGKFKPASQVADVNPRLDGIVEKAMRKEPARRYQAASEIQKAVDRVDAGPIQGAARPAKTASGPPLVKVGAWAGLAVAALFALLWMRSDSNPVSGSEGQVPPAPPHVASSLQAREPLPIRPAEAKSPRVTIELPSGGAIVPKRFTARGRVLHANGIVVHRGANAWRARANGDGEWSIELEASSEGALRYDFVPDAAIEAPATFLEVVADHTAPVIEFAQGGETMVTREPLARVVARVRDANLKSVRLGERELIAAADGSFAFEIESGASHGETRQTKLSAIDAAGNERPVVLRVERDTQAPAIAWKPVGDCFPGSRITFIGTSDEPLRAERIHGTERHAFEADGDVELPPLIVPADWPIEREFSVEFALVDRVGNEATQTISHRVHKACASCKPIDGVVGRCVACSGSAVVKGACGECKGRTDGIKCDTCKGKKKVKCGNCGEGGKHKEACGSCPGKGPKLGWVTCGDCKGAKRYMQPCNPCNASGKTMTFPQQRCGTCKGTKMSLQGCKACSRKGSKSCNSCNEGFNVVNCKQCDAGYLDKACAPCNGKGRVACTQCEDGKVDTECSQCEEGNCKDCKGTGHGDPALVEARSSGKR